MPRYFVYCLIISVLIACEPATPSVVTPAVYHWQARLQLQPEERSYLAAAGIEKLYLRFFDVDFDEERQEVVPLSILEVADSLAGIREVVPTVFITNRTFQALDETGVDTLGARMLRLLTKLERQLPEQIEVREWQLDCDWTATTRPAFFHLLERLRAFLAERGDRLSATIRLHQLAYPQQTGVPPVDRGMLMCYNTGDLQEPETENSILELGAVAPYLGQADQYPLPLDLVLPAFSWGVLFREGRMIRLIHPLSPAHLSDTSRFLALQPPWYQVRKSTYLEGYYLYRDDRLRLEAVEVDTLQAAARLLHRRLRPEDRTIALYHLDTTLVNRYPHGLLPQIARLFEEP